jgi:hypothetical protein
LVEEPVKQTQIRASVTYSMCGLTWQ